MTAFSISPAASRAARTTIRLVWFNFMLWALLGGLAGWSTQRSGGMGAGQFLLLLGVFLLLGFPTFRYLAWLGRVRRDAATEADQNRVVAWMGWSLIGAALGVFVSGGAVMAAVFGLLETHSVHLGRPDEVAPASAFPEFLALAGMLAYARPWVRALTAAQGMGSGRSVRLTAAVRATTPWVRALQVALVLVPVLDAAQMTTPDRWTGVIVAVPALLPIILILEFSLRFAWASAQELPGAPPVEPSTP